MDNFNYEYMRNLIDRAEELKLYEINKQKGFSQDEVLKQISLSDLMICSQLKRIADALDALVNHFCDYY